MTNKLNPELWQAMTGTDGTLEDAIEQWRNERVALAELFDENEAMKIIVRRVRVTLTLANQIVTKFNATDGGLFIEPKLRRLIEQFTEQHAALEKAVAHSKELTDTEHKAPTVSADANTAPHIS